MPKFKTIFDQYPHILFDNSPFNSGEMPYTFRIKVKEPIQFSFDGFPLNEETKRFVNEIKSLEKLNSSKSFSFGEIFVPEGNIGFY